MPRAPFPRSAAALFVAFSANTTRCWVQWGLTLLLVLTAACGRPSGSADEPLATSSSALTGVTLKSIAVTAASPSVYVGQNDLLAATGKYSDGSTQNLTTTATWTSSNTAVATVDGAGVVTPVGPGSVTVTAQSGTVKGHVAVKVLPTLTTIAVTPPSATLPANVAMGLTATGSYDNKTTKNLTSTVTWATSNPAVATVSAAGLLITVAPGTVTITASTSAAAPALVTGSATIKVDTATVKSVTVAPASKSLPKGTTQKLTATAVYTDGTKETSFRRW